MTRYFQKTTSAAPLAIFRIAFGLLLFGSVVRFWLKGWIHDLYIAPKFFFPFYGFEFVKPLGNFTYILFVLCGVAALMVAVGLYYRISAIMLFVSFTYIELIDKSTYLNHYYFISMICLMMIFLPAHVYFSVDANRNKSLALDKIPQWCIDSIKLFVCLIYVFAGLSKVNSEWLLQAQPLRIWLPSKNDLPFIGWIFNHLWIAYVFSWVGCLYDLCVPFLLLNRSTRVYAYGAVIVFHILTAILFPIGMFPYIMIVTALIFFPAPIHHKILARICRIVKGNQFSSVGKIYLYKPSTNSLLITGFTIFLLIQVVAPFRYMLYPGELFWTEEGYRFSWRVMLVEKSGHAEFVVRDEDGKYAVVENSLF